MLSWDWIAFDWRTGQQGGEAHTISGGCCCSVAVAVVGGVVVVVVAFVQLAEFVVPASWSLSSLVHRPGPGW